MKHLLAVKNLTKEEILDLIKKAKVIKKTPKKFQKSAYEKVLLTFFAAPSLRTELSFDSAMFQMGGEVIDYHTETSPWAKGKESLEDVARVVSRYCDLVMIRMHNHEELCTFAKNASIPVINGLTSVEHPCQILSDLLTIKEKKTKLTGLKIAYVGDANNNVTHSLIYACAILGIDLGIGCPHKDEFLPQHDVLKDIHALVKKNHCSLVVTEYPEQAVKDADIVYTDSWMSYRIPPEEHQRRAHILRPYQVNRQLLSHAKHTAIFMHCLPAKRGEEVTNEIIDGSQSVVFDQAENRLHMQKAIILTLLKKE